jgi:predicted outer membrane repeat protein
MRAFSWLWDRIDGKRRSRPPAARLRFRPGLEALEERWLPSTLTVQTTNDSGVGSLRSAIAAARQGDTINFLPGLFTSGPQIVTLSGELLIKHGLTIAGPGSDKLTISGGDTFRVFEIAPNVQKPVTLSGLTISDGFTTGTSYPTCAGGGIYNASTLTVSNCTLSHNSAPQGGAINNQGTLTLNNCTLSNNTALTNSGVGGAIMNGGLLMTVSGCTISGNSAPAGGGIWNGGTGKTTIDAGTTFSGNNAGSGGAIYNWNGGTGTLTITGCTLSDNTGHLGGGIFLFGGTLTVSGCTLTGNSATQGGGIYSRAGALVVSNTTFGKDVFGNLLPNTPDDISGLYVDGGGNSFLP